MGPTEPLRGIFSSLSSELSASLGNQVPLLAHTSLGPTPAFNEISVHIVFQEEAELQEAYKRNGWHLLTEVSLSEEYFKKVKTLVFGAFQAWKKNLNWT
ncbi:hypothetical protein Sjap_020904 [Stephania japonica]|uniref:GDPGP1-like C-terminal domain-containing protein n=1 Tax=Stephania japonica TaxID=461633 RepID=A0AAP0I0T1_9MAGN